MDLVVGESQGECEVGMPLCEGNGVYREDPFEEEINGKEILMFICGSCYTGLTHEI
jgi:hypothetical protein